MKKNIPDRIKSQKGFGLIEIMIALALGALILLGVTEIATNNSRTRAELERSGRQIESASYALRILESDLANAGYWGEAGEQPAGGTLPPVCPGLGVDLAVAGAELTAAMGFPVQGQDALGTSCITPKSSTDFIAVRRASSCALGVTGCDAAGGNFHLQTNACFDPDDTSAPLPGDLLLDSDLSNLDFTMRDCSTAAPQYRLLSRVYFINGSDQLVRAELVGTGAADYIETVLVDGVETLRIEYGVDTSGNGQVNLQTNTPTGAAWADVSMVRVSLVIRNLDSSPGYTDNKTYTVAGTTYTVPTAVENNRREVYSRTVSIRNVAGRREVH